MKRPIAAVLLLLLAACSSPEKKDSVNMTGAYKMMSQTLKSDKVDTSYSTRQQKIYSEGYVMFANFNPADSTSAFGIGTYTSNADTVTENVTYRASDSSRVENTGDFKLIIEKTGTGFKQVIPEIESSLGKIKLTEEYDSIGTNTSTILDGAWKMEKVFYIKGKDTMAPKTTQFKTYGSGRFIWGHTYTDSLNKMYTGIGYGKFAMDGSKLKETVEISTYREINGIIVDIALEMNGTDRFKQTIINKDSTRQVEIYCRMKK